MELPRCATNAELLELVRQSGRSYDVLAQTVFGLELICVRTGGDKQPAIVITAGAHAGEPSGVYAALELIRTLETDHAVYIVPLRDPFGWGGYARCLEYALGHSVEITSHSDVEHILRTEGIPVYAEEDHFLIALVGDLVFVSMRPGPKSKGRTDIDARLNSVLQRRPELMKQVAGRRVCMPANMPDVDGCGNFERAYSTFVTSGGLTTSLSHQFSYAYPAIEVESFRNLVDRIKPGLILDLHEGQGSGYYLFISPYRPGDYREDLAHTALDAVAEAGFDLYSLEDLGRRFGDLEARAMRFEEPTTGLLMGTLHSVAQGSYLEAYCQRYGAAMTLETGRWTSLSRRVQMHLAASKGVIELFEELHN